MKDIASLIKADEVKAKELLKQVLGPSADFGTMSKVVEELLPESTRKLQELCIFYENEMVRCRDAEAYFFGCLAGAAMIESFLLSISVLERKAVEGSRSFQTSRKKVNRAYEQTALHWTLKDLIPLAEELEWIGPTVVDKDLVLALVEGYREILPIAKPDITDESLEAVLDTLKRRPDVAFLVLMQSMRNLVHGGRCVRLRKQLASTGFSDWAKLVMILTVEIRDCLILRLRSIYPRYLTDLLSSPAGLSALAKLLVRVVEPST
jgi:hypothetical protein